MIEINIKNEITSIINKEIIINKFAKTCNELENISVSSKDSSLYYLWTSHSSVSIYGLNGEKCRVSIDA